MKVPSTGASCRRAGANVGALGWLFAAFTATACTGSIGSTDIAGSEQVGADGRPVGPSGEPGAPATTSTPPGVVGAGGVPLPTGDPNAAGLAPLGRLTRREYNNTVHDLLGDDTHPADQFPSDRETGFAFRRAGLVAVQDADVLRTAAETLSAAAIKNLPSLLPCDPAKGEDLCAKSFVQSFGKRAYRRPLTGGENDRLMALYAQARGALKLSFSDAVGVLVEGMLQSPAFLYHWESPELAPVHEGAVVRLDSYTLASRLSYFIWGSLPDAVLFDAADQGQLVTDEQISAQVRRMLQDPRAHDAVAAFFADWLETDRLVDRPKDPKVYPEYNDDLKSAMRGETTAFVQGVVFDGDGRLDSLLGSSTSFVNASLGSIYGTAVSGTALQKTNLDPSQRVGLLTQTAFLTLNGSSEGSHPVRRGKAVYEKLLCGTLPPPPADVPAPKSAASGGTTRQRFSEHDQNACAKGCHMFMDPIGFSFEHYDGIGRYRTMDNGIAVDSSGSVELDGKAETFTDAVALSGLLAKSAQVQTCFATQWLRFALDRMESDADQASVVQAAAAFARSSARIPDLIAAIATSRSFRYRSPAPGEMLP